MGAPYPILPNGHATTQGIWDTTTSAVVPVGTRAALPDGRAYYYARNSGVAIVAGNVLMSEIVDGDVEDAAVNTAPLGATTLDITPGGTKTFAANALQGGYVIVCDGTGEGITYRVASNPATTAATEFTVTLTDPIGVAFAAATTVTLVKNIWMDTVIAAAAQAHNLAGVSNVAVGAGTTTPQYFWCQTWGVAAVWHDGTAATGIELTSGTVAGQAEIRTAADVTLGVNMFTATDTEYGPVFLKVAP